MLQEEQQKAGEEEGAGWQMTHFTVRFLTLRHVLRGYVSWNIIYSQRLSTGTYTPTMSYVQSPTVNWNIQSPTVNWNTATHCQPKHIQSPTVNWK